MFELILVFEVFFVEGSLCLFLLEVSILFIVFVGFVKRVAGVGQHVVNEVFKERFVEV